MRTENQAATILSFPSSLLDLSFEQSLEVFRSLCVRQRRRCEVSSRPTFGSHEYHPQALLDHLIRPQQQRLRDRQAQRLRGLQVNDELDRPCLLDG